MRRFLFAGAAALALGLMAVLPSVSQASWLSEFIHSRIDPGYYAAPVYSYGDYYAPPAYDGGYYYSEPGVYYTTPYYYSAPSFYYWSGPRYYGHDHAWHGARGGHWHHHR
jgi:hypothetical protein